MQRWGSANVIRLGRTKVSRFGEKEIRDLDLFFIIIIRPAELFLSAVVFLELTPALIL
jgi:hypothetical protein